MKHEIKHITPEIAKEMLEFHPNRKPISQAIIDEMIIDINNNNFDKENANVVLYKDGGIFYGQYVINAIVQSGKELDLHIYQLEDGEEGHKAGSLNRNTKYKWKGYKPRPSDFLHRRRRFHEALHKHCKHEEGICNVFAKMQEMKKKSNS